MYPFDLWIVASICVLLSILFGRLCALVRDDGIIDVVNGAFLAICVTFALACIALYQVGDLAWETIP